MAVTRAQVVACARTYLSTPWHHQGRVKGPKGGIDCAGLIIGVARELGLADVDFTNYSRHPDGTLERICALHMRGIPLHLADFGDVLLFTFKTEPEHLGIFSEIDGRRTVIHSYASAKKVVENDLDALWLSRIRGAYRIPGVV